MVFSLRRAGLAALGFFSFSLAACALDKTTLSIITASGAAPATVVAEIARTPKEQQRGYMERTRIPDGTGMIFVFAQDQQLHFWMKNTPTPLSIAYIDSAGVIREIYDMAPLSLATVSSVHSVRYALEVPQGWFSRAGVAVGDSLSPESLAAVAAKDK